MSRAVKARYHTHRTRVHADTDYTYIGDVRLFSNESWLYLSVWHGSKSVARQIADGSCSRVLGVWTLTLRVWALRVCNELHIWLDGHTQTRLPGQRSAKCTRYESKCVLHPRLSEREAGCSCLLPAAAASASNANQNGTPKSTISENLLIVCVREGLRVSAVSCGAEIFALPGYRLQDERMDAGRRPLRKPRRIR